MSWHHKENPDSEMYPRKQAPIGHGLHTVLANFSLLRVFMEKYQKKIFLIPWYPRFFLRSQFEV
jgi:hypothetical protein